MTAHGASPAPQRILVIDDEPAMLKVLQLALSGIYRVTVATNGWEGLQAVQRLPFDLVISDRAMPEMTGDQLADVVRTSFPGTPIILISGIGGMEADSTLFDAFLRKPFTTIELLDAVRKLLAARTAG